MKVRGNLRSMLTALLLLAAVTVSVVALGCFGGGDEDNAGNGTTVSGGGTDGGQTSTSLVASVDPLSSFKSKDPFIPQAQLTSTTARIVVTTVSRVTTTTVRTTTTAPHRLTVSAFPGDGTVSFSLDGLSLTGFGAGAALFTGGWGSIQILSINDTVQPFTATFRRNNSIDFTLRLTSPYNTQTW